MWTNTKSENWIIATDSIEDGSIESAQSRIEKEVYSKRKHGTKHDCDRDAHVYQIKCMNMMNFSYSHEMKKNP